VFTFYEQGEKMNVKFWTPQEGISKIRFLPNKNHHDFFATFHAHYIPLPPTTSKFSRKVWINDDAFIMKICTYDNSCPFCAEGHKSFNRVLFNVYDMQEKLPSKQRRKVFIWNASYHVLNQVLDIRFKYDDITNHSKGRNVIVLIDTVEPYMHLRLVPEIKSSRVQIFKSDLYDLNEVIRTYFQYKPTPAKPYLRMIRLM